MNSDNLFSYITSQDEYHCFLEKSYSRAVKFYSETIPNIGESLIENYIQMEKSCWKEDYTVASFYYIRQLEIIIHFGIESVGVNKISDDLRQKAESDEFILSLLGEKILNYPKNKNSEHIKNILGGSILEIKNLQWTVKQNLYKHYFTCNPDYKIDEVLYYKRNHHAHENPSIEPEKEIKFLEYAPTYLHFLTITRRHLGYYQKALNIPKNRV